MTTTRIIFGCGYLGLRAAQQWQASGDHIVAVSRSKQGVADLASMGLDAIQGDVTQAESLAWLPSVNDAERPTAESLLFAVGFDRSAGHDIQTVYANGLANVLAALPPTVTRCVYISSTGVYGDAGGEWVDENAPPAPQRAGGAASLAAEQVLANHPLGKQSVVLRLAGIYGPGRIPYLDKFRNGEPIPAPAEGWLNLIHVDDAARIVVAVDRWAAEQPNADGTWLFNVSDGVPVKRGNYYREVARQLKAPEPQFVAPDAASTAAARATVSRRISNARLMSTLSFELTFSDYRSGLESIFSDDSHC